jgi:kojibiose phosphorylase
LYLLPDEVSDQTLRANYDYYTPRTDYTFGSSLGPSVGAIMAGQLDRMEEAYALFMRGVRADLHDVRGNARDGIHGASAGGIWQAAVFGFGGLRVTPEGWTVDPRLPSAWSRLAFRFYHRGRLVDVDLKPEKNAVRK